MIYAAFCGTGKTYILENFEGVVEFECWKYDNEYFPNNYVNDIKSKIYDSDCILISTNPVGLKELNRQGIKVTLVYPRIECKREYLRRYIYRGSSDDFINMLDKEWENWLIELQLLDFINHIILEKGQYLSDIIYLCKK